MPGATLTERLQTLSSSLTEVVNPSERAKELAANMLGDFEPWSKDWYDAYMSRVAPVVLAEFAQHITPILPEINSGDESVHMSIIHGLPEDAARKVGAYILISTAPATTSTQTAARDINYASGAPNRFVEELG